MALLMGMDWLPTRGEEWACFAPNFRSVRALPVTRRYLKVRYHLEAQGLNPGDYTMAQIKDIWLKQVAPKTPIPVVERRK